MAKTNPRKILLVGRGYRFEKVAAETITPGHLVIVNSSDGFIKNTGVGRVATIFCVELDHEGKGIDDNYLVNDHTQAEHVYSGCQVNALVAAAAAALVVGDRVESAGDGTVRKAAGLTGTLTGTNNGALNDITFNATWSTAQANEINANFKEIQSALSGTSAIGFVVKAVDNSAGGTPARCQICIL
jgi:hypothetical protein